MKFQHVSAFGLFTLCSATAVAQTESFMCVSGTLYKPNGQEVYVGLSGCDDAKIFGRVACVAGSVYLSNGQNRYVGQGACAQARMSASFLCANATLFHWSGWTQSVGSGCAQAVLMFDAACVNGLLYRADGSSTYVGQQGCSGFRPQ
jgi:hypothetical protein